MLVWQQLSSWEPKTQICLCGRLTGFFLGGHDRDLYIKCTSSEFANLPMIDVMQGGCIMTCSHFEKAAGRELSKKCALLADSVSIWYYVRSCWGS